MSEKKKNWERDQIEQNLREVHRRIEDTCHRIGRNPSEIRLLLATKTVPPEVIKYAIDAGENLIGENKVQELVKKDEVLRPLRPERHFIGHLQTNKINSVLKYVDCIQSIDRLDLAKKLDQRLKAETRKLDVLLQVNTSGEESKFGVIPEHAIPFVIQVSRLTNLRIRGLMSIGLFSENIDKVRPGLRMLKNLWDEVKLLELPGVQMDILSMGMSHDLEVAIEEGSTMVRVGTAIFGDRGRPDSYYWNESK